MPINDWDVFAQFGIAGLILGVFFVLVWLILTMNAKTIKGIVDRMSTDHKDANTAWRETFAQHAEQADRRQSETNTVLRELSTTIAMANEKTEYKISVSREEDHGHESHSKRSD